MSALAAKSLTQLRSIAQGYQIADIFQKTNVQLIQEIELKQKQMLPKPEVVIPKPEYDARLMTKPPAKSSDQDAISDLLKTHVASGLHLSFDEERWYMKHGKKTDEGTLRMPLRTVLNCADRILRE
jgi:hypothetical protein